MTGQVERVKDEFKEVLGLLDDEPCEVASEQDDDDAEADFTTLSGLCTLYEYTRALVGDAIGHIADPEGYYGEDIADAARVARRFGMVPLKRLDGQTVFPPLLWELMRYR